MNLVELLQKRGIDVSFPNSHGEIILTCPKCNKPKHLYFNIYKKVGYCQRCKEKISFMELMRSLGLIKQIDQVSIFKNIAKQEGIDDLKLDFVVSALKSRRALKYLENRNISREEIESRNILYCYGGNYIDMVIVPIYDKGNMVFFVARDLSGKRKTKYLFSKNSQVSHYIYNIDNQRNDLGVIVEGVFPAIQFGFMASFGCSLSDIQIKKLVNKGFDEIVLLWDYGAEKETYKAARKLFKQFKVKVIKLSKERPQPDDWEYDDLRRKIKSTEFWDGFSPI